MLTRAVIGKDNLANFRGQIVLMFLVFCNALFGGCAYRLKPYSQASQQKIRVKSALPHDYTVSVADENTFQVPEDGRVIVDIPQLPRGCDVYLFEVVKIGDGSPYNLRVIQLKQKNRVIRKLSLNDIAKLPVDKEGYHVLKVK
jgi:hypothetical protein